jgi:hypothetical protein
MWLTRFGVPLLHSDYRWSELDGPVPMLVSRAVLQPLYMPPQPIERRLDRFPFPNHHANGHRLCLYG